MSYTRREFGKLALAGLPAVLPASVVLHSTAPGSRVRPRAWRARRCIAGGIARSMPRSRLSSRHASGRFAAVMVAAPAFVRAAGMTAIPPA